MDKPRYRKVVHFYSRKWRRFIVVLTDFEMSIMWATVNSVGFSIIRMNLAQGDLHPEDAPVSRARQFAE